MTIRLTNTLGGAKEEFVPLDPPNVSLYVCGPTVYDVPHVGHARRAVVFDVLRRHLTWRGYDVLVVENVTDVDDKIIHKAGHEDADTAVVAERYTRAYDDMIRALNVLPPDIAPRASGHIIEMIEMIEKLVERGFAYPGDGSVWFAVEKFDGYGKLSGRSLDDIKTRERVEPEPGKVNLPDFALWKAAKPGEPFWPSPWGPGRPGWHIECSAMALKYLGIPFDIHGGGADLIFPHHENEIAQAEAACGVSPFARFWLHNGHLQIDGEKMSKSLKNYINVSDVLEDYPPQVLRLFFLGAHYRSQMSYDPDALGEARTVWDRFRGFLRSVAAGDVDKTAVDERLRSFGEAMDDDLNTPLAISELHAIVSEGNREPAAAPVARAALERALVVLGCAPGPDDASALVGPLIELLLEQREAARAAKDFARSDEIRAKLDEVGVRVEDSPQGPRWFIQ